jgi:exosome complex RNA-binding protein Rrp42 (RNase PH superfamily)
MAWRLHGRDLDELRPVKVAGDVLIDSPTS